MAIRHVIWRSRGPSGRKVKHVAFGYNVWIDGRRERRFDSAWTEEDAGKALAARVLNVEQAEQEKRAGPSAVTFGELAERYLAHKTAAGKRSMRNDRLYLRRGPSGRRVGASGSGR